MSNAESVCAAQSGTAPSRRRTPAEASAEESGSDLRGTTDVRGLRFAAGDRVVVSGLPGSGKSTLIRRVVAAHEQVERIDSQDMRNRWQRRLPHWLPYGLYRPLVRAAHYLALRRALALGSSVVVHDCGTQGWVRRWLALDARRRGRSLHMVLLDVPPAVALRGQTERGRRVSAYAFARHRRAVRRLVEDVAEGRLPAGCASAVLLDRGAAGALRGIVFEPSEPLG
ncbi:MAG TPA: AAA family ATPase [Streptomyces sp.]|nr:AAA family ATPase [Streptomyces sp.]